MIFTILKVIGIILLILLGLALLVILSVLFVPLRYSGSGSFDNADVHADIRASWFLHLFVFKLRYDEKVTGYYRIAFIKRELFEEDADTESDEEILPDSSQPAGQVLYTADAVESKQNEKNYDSTSARIDEKNVSGEESISQENDGEEIAGKNEIDKENSDTDNAQKKEKYKKSGNSKKKHGDSIINKLTGAIKKFQKLYSDSRNKAAIGHLKDELFLILKRICPKKLALTATFSTGEPDTTGILLGVIAMFPIGYTNRWQITPDFESDNAFAKGNFKIKGRIFTISIIAALLRILFDKNCRRLYNKIAG